MRTIIKGMLIGLAFAGTATAQDRVPPSLLFPGLFEDVAEAKIYEPKDWADAIPLRDTAAILADYEAQTPFTEEDLRVFAEANFDMPEQVAAPLDLPADRTLKEHIELLWAVLTREAQDDTAGSLLPLPHPYIVPGGRFREAYYWDTFFTMLGLDTYPDAKQDMLANFADAIDRYGHVPNGNRTYYLSRSQPPFFGLMALWFAETNSDEELRALLVTMKAEHAFWMKGEENLAPGEANARLVRLSDGTLLNRYYDNRDVPRDESYIYDVETAEKTDRPATEVYRDLRAAAESGWDFSSRWFADGETLATIRTTQIAPVDLNALLWNLEEAIAGTCLVAGDDECAMAFRQRAVERRDAIRQWFWDDDAGHFRDLDLTTEELTGGLTAASVYPLAFPIATAEQGTRVAEMVRNELLLPGGLVTTTVETGEQWDAPNGWPPLQFLVVWGLSSYGEKELADDITRRWLVTVARSFCETGKLAEKYNVAERVPGGGGEYPSQDGFGWTNGVTAWFLSQDQFAAYGDTPVLLDASECAQAVR